MHIAIAGNIGSGKTTLTNKLAKHYNWTPNYEDAEQNPYLNDFYNDMPRWAFNLQVYFLHSRLKKILECKNSGQHVIQDRTIYEDAYIFAANLYDMNLMSERDYRNYLDIFEFTTSLLQAPDLLIYLRANVPTLIKQIKKRGRQYEQSISPDYLTKLNQKYDLWSQSYNSGKILTIDVENLDFANSDKDFISVTKLIDEKLK
ncbi:MAG: deoxynucleoside kinase [Bacteroidales bacterium]|jgi:deoxyadenosine/deoxycytidine kinase|nr:deoxynucleoside kinase [Bacteroidales bacterium]